MKDRVFYLSNDKNKHFFTFLVLGLLRRRTTTVAPIASTSVSTAVSAASTTASGRRRRQLNEGDASTPPLVTYRD